MPRTLTKDQHSTLEKITLKAREAAEVAARAALDNLAVHEERPRAHLDEDRRRLRNRLRARGRALGDRLDPGGTQTIDQLVEATAYVHWHRLLFTRFLAESHLLHTSAEHGSTHCAVIPAGMPGSRPWMASSQPPPTFSGLDSTRAHRPAPGSGAHDAA